MVEKFRMRNLSEVDGRSLIPVKSIAAPLDRMVGALFEMFRAMRGYQKSKIRVAYLPKDAAYPPKRDFSEFSFLMRGHCPATHRV